MSTETLIQAGAFSQIKAHPQRASALACGAASAWTCAFSGLNISFKLFCLETGEIRVRWRFCRSIYQEFKR